MKLIQTLQNIDLLKYHENNKFNTDIYFNNNYLFL